MSISCRQGVKSLLTKSQLLVCKLLTSCEHQTAFLIFIQQSILPEILSEPFDKLPYLVFIVVGINLFILDLI